MLQIFLLGSFQIHLNDKLIPESAWHTKQARQLLKILLTQRGKIVSRDTLIDALWPDANPNKAATTLRTAVNALRKTLEPNRPPYTPSSFIVAHAPGYKFQFTDQVWVDALEFERLLDEAKQTDEPVCQQTLLTDALALYQDDYLCDDLYVDWAYLERERLRERYLHALISLASCQAGFGEYERAIASLRRVLTRDPGREPVYRSLMRYNLQMGNTVAALKTFEQLRSYLNTELGADPSPQTLALHQSILNGQFNWRPTPAISPPVPQSPLETIFVGRQHELDALTAFLRDAQQGRGRMVGLTGENGMGKTRLATALLQQAEAKKTLILSARCQAVEQTLPFAPLIEALETLFAARPNRLLAQLAEADKIQLAQLLPSLAWRVDVDPTSAGSPESNRQRLLNSLINVLLKLGQNTLILFIDDLQWVDAATLTLLSKLNRYLAKSKILVLTAYRPAEIAHNSMLLQFLRDVQQHRLMHTLALSRFSAQEIELYLQKIVPNIESQQDLPEQIAQRLHLLTGGNPLFLAETIRALIDERSDALIMLQALLTDPALEQPSRRLANIITARLEQLPPDARTLLDIGAAIGRDFSVDLLETVATTDPLPALTILLQRQFVVETDAGRLDFSHQLVREVIYNRLSPLAKQRLHQRVTQALVTLYGKQAGPRSAEIADHCERSGLTYRPQTVSFLVLAGDYAMRAFGFEEAARRYRQALNLADGLVSASELASWIQRAYQGLGTAQESMMAWEQARETYLQCQGWAEREGNTQLALMAQYRLASMLGLIGQLDESATITARISRQLPPNTPSVIVNAQRRLNLLVLTKVTPPTATESGWPVFTPDPVDEDRPWRQLAQFLGLEQAAQTLNLYGWALFLQGQTEAAEETLYYAAQLAAGYKQPGLQATSYHLLAQLWDLQGEYTRMAQSLNRALALVQDIPHLRWIVIWGRIHQAYVDVRWNRLARAGRRLHALNDELTGHTALRSHWLSVQVGLGLVAMFKQDAVQATRYFETALANLKNLYASNYVAVYLSRARLNRKRKNFEAAQRDIMRAMSFAGERGLLADYISALVEAARFDRAMDQPHYVLHLLQQAEAMATRANLLTARLSVRMALMRVYRQLNQPNDADWYQRLARTDRDAIAATIPDPVDRAAYLSRQDFKLL